MKFELTIFALAASASLVNTNPLANKLAATLVTNIFSYYHLLFK